MTEKIEISYELLDNDELECTLSLPRDGRIVDILTAISKAKEEFEVIIKDYFETIDIQPTDDMLIAMTINDLDGVIQNQNNEHNGR